MSNSRLASFVFTNHSKYSSRDGNKISRITIHHAAGAISLEGLANIIKSDREVSYNYGIGVDGKVGLFVDERNRAWTSSSASNDSRAVTIEVSNAKGAGEPNWVVSTNVYKVLIALCADICKRNNIPRLTYTGELTGSNLTMHKWFAATGCPGPYLTSKFPDIANQVNKLLSSGNTLFDSMLSGLTLGINTDAGVTSYDYAVTGTTEFSQSLVDTSKLNPYIITTSRQTAKVDYVKLKKNGVVGVVLESGRLYDVLYSEMRYQNPRLDAQIDECRKANLPYGLYTDVRARNERECRRELEELSLTVRTHPPQLGFWLKLNMNQQKSMNNRIVDLYYECMVKLGLKYQCGFYVTKAQLAKIDWKKYQDNWYLWIDDHVSSVESLNQLLTPKFFTL